MQYITTLHNKHLVCVIKKPLQIKQLENKMLTYLHDQFTASVRSIEMFININYLQAWHSIKQK